MKITNLDELTHEIELLDEETSELFTLKAPETLDLSELQLWDEVDVMDLKARFKERA